MKTETIKAEIAAAHAKSASACMKEIFVLEICFDRRPKIHDDAIKAAIHSEVVAGRELLAEARKRFAEALRLTRS